MPVEAGTSEFVYVGDGVTTTFPFPSRFFAASDLYVGLNSVLQNPSTYTVTGAGSAFGGDVTFLVPPAAGVGVLLLRKPVASQLVDFVNGQTILEGTLDNAFDRLTMIVQYVLRLAERAIRLSDLDPSLDMTLPLQASRAGNMLEFDADGKPTAARSANAIVDGLENLNTTLAAAQAAKTDAETAKDDAETAKDDAEAALAANIALAAIPLAQKGAANGVAPLNALSKVPAEYLSMATLSLRPEDYGAVGDGVANDTAAWATMMAALGAGVSIELKPGAVYLVDQIDVPNTTSDWRYNRIFCSGTATIKKRASANATYLVASARWLSGNAGKIYANSPVRWENIIFDAASNASYAVVNKSYGSEFIGCRFLNALADGCLFTRKNQDGTLGSASYLSGNKWVRCTSQGNIGWSIRTQGSAADDTDAPTDGFIVDCNLDCGGGAGAIKLANAGGWAVRGNHTFAYSGAQATVAEVLVDKLANVGQIAENTIEGPVVFGKIGQRASTVGPGNNFWGPVTVNFTPDASEELIAIVGNMFSHNGAVYSTITHNYNSAAKTIVSDNIFESDDPHLFGAGVTLGMFEVVNRVSGLNSDAPNNSAAKLAFDRTCSRLTLIESDFTIYKPSGYVEHIVCSGSNSVFMSADATRAYGGTHQNIPYRIVQGNMPVFEADASGTKLAFFGAATVTKPAVTGSCEANAALTSLCAALASLGLITNLTT